MLSLKHLLPICVLPTVLISCIGCHHGPVDASTLSPAEQRVELETQREELEQIPPPTKSRYMSIHTYKSWENPVLTIQPGMLELHVTLADSNPTPIGVGGMFRPIGARQEELNISTNTLGDAISAVPQTSWPYGRVVAIEEANKTPPSAEPAVRRNMEATISKLNDLGIVVYDLESGKLQ
ncbi:MAG: hypothetical protein HIU91_04385 [Acidobacteria bacterium]|nr:hypothetical protein [Acidobacteriota bacterium]